MNPLLGGLAFGAMAGLIVGGIGFLVSGCWWCA